MKKAFNLMTAISLLIWTFLIWAFIGYGLFCVLVAMITEPFSAMGILSWILMTVGAVAWRRELRELWNRIVSKVRQ